MNDDVVYYNPPKAKKLTSLYSHVARVRAGEMIYIAGQVPATANTPGKMNLRCNLATCSMRSVLS